MLNGKLNGTKKVMGYIGSALTLLLLLVFNIAYYDFAVHSSSIPSYHAVDSPWVLNKQTSCRSAKDAQI